MSVFQNRLTMHLSEMNNVSKRTEGYVTDHWSVLPIVEEVVTRENAVVQSCLDIGSGARPKHEWFRKAFEKKEGVRFAALEADEKLRKQLSKINVSSEESFSSIPERSYDLSIALEVIEHLRPESSIDFLRQIERVTNKIFAMTVPNFEYWNERFRAKPAFKDIRWIPDHFVAWDPDSDNPHKHKQMTTPNSIRRYLGDSFPAEHWHCEVIRAWPWELKDLARGFRTRYYFKVFAVAMRRSS